MKVDDHDVINRAATIIREADGPREADIPLGVKGVSIQSNGVSALQAMDGLLADMRGGA